ncbi:transporter substrate-binding domain-containing protein [Rhodospira trueperi]|uniref:ABC-type amino acid transport substrate-binding protein n=1 Tax=Rhodospira trueperi TaxID=69960 RepID=A0A1G7H5T4_9PROT|nr:transporter substrate-binding domain-containing protein [Rhodospira trueperi]SDE95817.1 ABC-type amino acid transport substrate-binding protein [Rhodospira trueperi]
MTCAKRLLLLALVVLLDAPHALAEMIGGRNGEEAAAQPTANGTPPEPVELLIGVRADAAPFAIRAANAEEDAQGRYNWDDWSGYTVDICKNGVNKFIRWHPEEQINPFFVEIKASQRIDLLVTERGDKLDPALDMVCGAVSVTPERQARVPFSDVLFVDARAAARIQEGGLFDFSNQPSPEDVLRVGYVRGSTAKESLADVAAYDYPTHVEGLAALACRKLDLYVTDRSILQDIINNPKNPVRLRLQENWQELVSEKCENVYALYDDGTGQPPEATGDDDPPQLSGSGSATSENADADSINRSDDRHENETDSGPQAAEHYLKQSRSFFSSLEILPNQLSLERYAIPVRVGHDGLLWAINLAIAEHFRDGEGAFGTYFPGMQPTPLIRALIFIRGGGQ